MKLLRHLSPQPQQLQEQIEELETVAQKEDWIYYSEPQHKPWKQLRKGVMVQELTYVKGERSWSSLNGTEGQTLAEVLF